LFKYRIARRVRAKRSSGAHLPRRRLMLRKIWLMSSVAALAAFPVWAQEAQPTEPTPLPAPAEQIEPMDPAAPPESQSGAQQEQVPSDGAIGEIAPEVVTPPPAEAIIPAQAANEVRADALIGMSVFNAAGDKVGEVRDILFNESGQATGVVLSVGGVLGLGAKSVGLNWSEVDVRPDSEMVKVKYSKEQLEAAPDFKTQEAQQAEADAARLQEQQTPPAATDTIPQPAPTPTE
jgi:sporulation protein YlmC with PRC-barrel domain